MYNLFRFVNQAMQDRARQNANDQSCSDNANDKNSPDNKPWMTMIPEEFLRYRTKHEQLIKEFPRIEQFMGLCLKANAQLAHWIAEHRMCWSIAAQEPSTQPSGRQSPHPQSRQQARIEQAFTRSHPDQSAIPTYPNDENKSSRLVR